MYIISSIFPVFAIIALGIVLKKARFINTDIFKGINKLTYWVGLPCFLFYKISIATFAGGKVSQIYLVILITMLATILLAYLIAWFARISNESTGAFLQAVFRGNLAFIGLPVIVYASAFMPNADVPAIQTTAVLALAPTVPTFNFISVFVLLLGRQTLNVAVLKRMSFQIITNPLLIACGLGLLFSFLKIEIPLAIDRTLNAIGQMSLPLALIGIGGSLEAVKNRGSLLLSTVAALIKVMITPILGYFLILLFDCGAAETKIAMIYLSCPTAVTSYVMATQLGADEVIAANAVVISTILSIVSLSIAIAI